MKWSTGPSIINGPDIPYWPRPKQIEKVSRHMVPEKRGLFFRRREGEKNLPFRLSGTSSPPRHSCGLSLNSENLRVVRNPVAQDLRRGERGTGCSTVLSMTVNLCACVAKLFVFYQPLRKILIASFHQMAMCMTNSHTRAGLPTLYVHNKRKSRSRPLCWIRSDPHSSFSH